MLSNIHLYALRDFHLLFNESLQSTSPLLCVLQIQPIHCGWLKTLITGRSLNTPDLETQFCNVCIGQSLSKSEGTYSSVYGQHR